MKTSYGLEFKVLSADKIDSFCGYDKSVAKCHIANSGKIIVDSTFGQPIDNEFDLEEIYSILNS